MFPADRPREDQILNPEGIEEDRYEKIGEDITEILAYQPGNIFVKRIIRPRWALKKEEKSEEHPKTSVQEKIPTPLISRGLVGERVVAQLVEGKRLSTAS